MVFRLVCGGWLIGRSLAASGQAPAPSSRPAPTDSARAEAALAQAKAVVNTDSALAWRAARQSLALSRRGHYPYGEAQASRLLGALCTFADRYPAALAWFGRARAIYATLHRRRPSARTGQGLAGVHNNEGVVFDKLGDRERAIKSYLAAADYFAGARDTVNLSIVYTNVGAEFADLQQPDKGLKYFVLGIGLLERSHRPVELTQYVNAALLLLDQHKFRAAAPYLRRARQLAERPDAPLGVEKDLYYKAQGIYFRDQGFYRPAETAFRHAAAVAERRGAKLNLADIYNQLGQLYGINRRYALAEAAFRRYLQLAREIGNPEQRLVALQQLAENNVGLGRSARAAEYYRQVLALKDSVAGEATKRQINALETRYQVRQQETEIATLRQAQRLQAAELNRKTTLFYGALALLAAGAGAGGLGYVAVRRGRRLAHQQQQLQQQKIQELEQERLLLATEALLKGQEEERGRLARDLHDGLGGMLSTVKYSLGSLRSPAVLPAEGVALLNHSLTQLDRSIGELRRVARDLMPEALLQFGLCPALRDVVHGLNQAGRVQAQFQCVGLEERPRLPQRTELVLYRLVQELLHNVLKHAQARQVIVQLSRHGQQVQVVVEDDGRGFDPAQVRAGVGLRSIRARTDYLRGQLDVHSVPGQGTTVTVEFDLPAA